MSLPNRNDPAVADFLRMVAERRATQVGGPRPRHLQPHVLCSMPGCGYPLAFTKDEMHLAIYTGPRLMACTWDATHPTVNPDELPNTAAGPAGSGPPASW